MIITIDLDKVASQSAYAKEHGISLSTVAQQIRAGKVGSRDIPELGIKLVELTAPLKLSISAPPLHHYTTGELGKYFIDLITTSAQTEHNLKDRIQKLEEINLIIENENSLQREHIAIQETIINDTEKKYDQTSKEKEELAKELAKVGQDKKAIELELAEYKTKTNVLETLSFEQEKKIVELSSKVGAQKEIQAIISAENEKLSKSMEKVEHDKKVAELELVEFNRKTYALEKLSYDQEIKIVELSLKVDAQKDIQGIISVFKDSLFKQRSIKPFTTKYKPKR